MQNLKIFILFLLLPICCPAQDSQKLPLSVILDRIEKAHNIKISRIDEELKVYSIAPPDSKLSLKDKLNYIEQHTKLKIEAINSTYYTIYNNPAMDKPLCGYLIDNETGLGIENAEIIVSSTAIRTSSGATGYFSIPVLTPNKIYVKHLGYTEKSISPELLYTTDCPKILLLPIVVELEEVVTERYLATGITKKESGELVVKPARFGILPGLTEPDVLQTMLQIPGIMSLDETVSNINVRGGTHDQNLFLWNGIRMYQTGHFFGLMSAFNSLPATKITIYKNGSPAFFGESVSSLVDISTHTGFDEDTYNVISADMINAGFLSRIKLSEKDKLQISARRTYTDLFVTPTFKDYQDRVFQNTTITDTAENQTIPVNSDEDYRFYDLSLEYEHKINDQQELIVSAIGMENAVDIYQYTETASRSSELTQRNIGGSINWKSDWNEKNHSDITAYISWYNLNGTNDAIENEQITQQRNKVLDKGLKLKHTYIFSTKLNFSAGYQIYEIEIENFDETNSPFFSRDSKETLVAQSIIAEGQYLSENKASRITGGIRGNYYDKFGLLIAEPRLAYSQKLADGLALEILGEQKSQTTAQIIDLQQDFLGIEKRRWVLANENDVPVQRSSQASLGLNYSQNRWLITIEGFYKKVKGITSDSQSFQNQFEFISATGKYSVAGAEVLLQKNFGRFYSWVSYSYNDNKYHFNGFLPPGFANNFAILHAVSCAGIYDWNKLRIALGAKWRTGKPITEPSGYTIDTDNPANSSITYNSPNSSNLEDYIQVNFSASKTWELGKKTLLTASCSVLNILDRNNVINRYYRINRANNNVETINTYSLGRTPNIGVKLLF